jgi:hypothetical protein
MMPSSSEPINTRLESVDAIWGLYMAGRATLAETRQAIRDGYRSLPTIDRYRQDPAFHRLVDMLADLIHTDDFNEQELQDALDLARLYIAQRQARAARKLWKQSGRTDANA